MKLSEALEAHEEHLDEISRRRAAAIGFAAGGLPGAAIGASVAKGKQRTLADQIKKGKEKISAWQKEDSKKNADKIKRMQKKISTWQSHLSYLKSSGKGKAGVFRKNLDDKKDK